MTLIPEGTWRGRATTFDWGWTSKDKEQIGIELVFSPNQDAAVDGKTLTWYGTFSEKAEPHTLKALRTLGWEGNDLSDLSGFDANEVDIVVIHEPDYNNAEVTRAKVRFINPIRSGGVAMKNRMLPEQVEAFAERMKGRVLAMKQKTATPSPAAQSAVAKAATASGAGPSVAPPDDDQIPF